MRLRHDGFLAHRYKAYPLRRCRELLGQPSEPPPRRGKNVGQSMQEVTGIDLTQCPHCGSRPLVQLPLPPLSTRAASRGRCRSTTRHEPSVASQVAAVDTSTATPEPSGGRACLRGGGAPDLLALCG